MGLSLGRIITLAASFVYGVYSGNWMYFIQASASAHQSRVAKRDRRRAIARFNASLANRLEMAEPTPNAPRSRVYGRVRYVEGIRRRWSSGTNKERLTMIVSHAGHQIDGFEEWYLNDTLVALDGDGWVTTAPWSKIERQNYVQGVTLNAGGGGSFTMPRDILGNVRAIPQNAYTGRDSSTANSITVVSVVGRVVTLSGGVAGALCNIFYEGNAGGSKVRIRAYLGTDGQNVGSDLAAESEGNVDANDRFAGIALTVVDCLFDPDVFPQGRPNVTPVLRGARVYDPRKDSTVLGGSGSHRIGNPATWEWSENPALIAYDYARWAYGWNLRPQDIMPPEQVAAEAAFCDTPTVFTLRKPDGSTSTVTLPRYRCGTVVLADADQDSRSANMAAILESMAGVDGWDGGVWRFRAGRAKSPVFTLDERWLVNRVSGGKADNAPVLTFANAFSREQRTNRVTGTCVDPDQRWQSLPFPAVQDPVLVAAKGARVEELNMAAVTHVAHAQHLASVFIRQAQAGTRLKALCGVRAYRVELFDVGTMLLQRQGMDAMLGKTMELTGRKWSVTSGWELSLAEVAEPIFAPAAELRGRDPAPDSNLRPPWDVESIGGVTAVAAEATIIDRSVVTRTVVTWNAATSANIRQGGDIEIQYVEAASPLPAGDWPSQTERGDATRSVIVGLLTQRVYFVRVRAVQRLPLVRGPWSVTASVRVGAPRPPRVFRQAAAPTGDVQQDDVWFDTDDSNHPYTYTGAAWVSTRDASIAAALATAQAAQATADGKIDTFWQTSAPASAAEGDIWFDTDDGNRQYRRTGGAWVVAADTRIGAAIANAATAQATADGKVRTFVLASPPAAEAIGDLWLDSDDGFRMYRWSGSAWVDVRDQGIAAALSSAAAAQATADGKIDTFWQASAPASAAEGDIWFDTDDGNRQYRRTGGVWVLAADTRIGTAIANAATAQATADGKVTTFVQDNPPTAGAIGDLWLDSNDGYRMYRWSGSAWADVRDNGIAQALNAAADAQATADGKIDTFWQASAPASAAEGDIWFDTDDGNRQYRRTGGAWVVAADTRIGQAITAAADAQATADGKVTTFVQATAPVAEAIGDLWLDTDDGNKLYRWSGSGWIALPLGTGALQPGAATTVVSDRQALSYTFDSTAPGFLYRVQRVLSLSWTNNTGATVDVELAGSVGGTKASGPGQVWIDMASSSAPLNNNVFSSLVADLQHTEATAAYRRYTHTDSLPVAAGATIYFAISVYVYSALGTSTAFSGDGNLRIVVIKR